MLIVQKFGGSSLADLDRLRRAAAIALRARRAGHRVAVVVSAMGDSTDELLARAREILPEPSPRELDALLNTGEQRSAALFALTVQSLGGEARSFTGWQAGIVTEGPFGDSRIAAVRPERLRPCLESGAIPVVCGFQGSTDGGELTTLGRGGSDTTAVALAEALAADRCEIYTEVSGVYTADPRRVPEARLLGEIDVRDMLALARAGAQVLHDRSVELALRGGVPLWVLPAFTEGAGTAVRWLDETRRPALAGATAHAGSVTLAGREAASPMLSRLMLALEKAHIPIEGAAVRSGAVSVRVPENCETRALQLAHGLIGA